MTKRGTEAKVTNFVQNDPFYHKTNSINQNFQKFHVSHN